MQKLSRIIIRTFLAFGGLLVVFSLFTYFYMRHAKFGGKPSGERLSRMEKSPHYVDGKFVNLNPTPELTEGYTMMGVTYNQFFRKAERRRPVDSIPSVKTDLHSLPPNQDVLVWFGHSSYYIQIDGKRLLADPVFSGNASPIPGTVTSFPGTDIYSVDDLPEIDYLFISHDHYDHVDYETLIKLRVKVKKVFCGLGVGAHLEHWGYPKEMIIEKDWGETIEADSGFVVHTTPARHFSGRGFKRNTTLWMSYVVQTPSMKIYIGGDSGYDTHFADIGKKYGPIDLAIIENGQYDLAWRYIHTLPDEVLQAARDLGAKKLFPVHSSKFVLANHPWDEPLAKVSELNANSASPIKLVTPMIGEPAFLKDDTQQFRKWWVGVK